MSPGLLALFNVMDIESVYPENYGTVCAASEGAATFLERVEALEHLDFAIAEFRDMKMQPSLERVLRHKEILKAQLPIDSSQITNND